MHLADAMVALPPGLMLVAAFALPALESSAFVGFVFPGETALVLGGVLAGQGRLPIVMVVLAGILGAILGDSVGYAVGRRFGPALLRGPLRRVLPAEHLDRATALVRRRGGLAIFLGRWAAALRVFVPGVAGMSGVRYRTFLLWNVIGGIGWAIAAVLVGYLAGQHWQQVSHLLSLAGLAGVAGIVVLLLVPRMLRRRAGASRSDADAVAIEPLSTGAGAVVVVPTYDEAENIGHLLDRVLAAVPDAHVLVVDDNSPDGTARIVRDRPELGRSVFLLERPGKQGLGAAYRAGFAWALDHGYDAVVQMDADLSHPPERLPALVGALGQADVAVGSRYVEGGGVRNWAWHRRLISRAGNVYVALVLGLGTHDATAGFKAFRRRALVQIGATTADSEGYCFQIENAWRARRRGLRVAEVPITFTDRRAGSSKMSGSILSEAVFRVLGWRLREIAVRHRDLPAFLAVGGAGYVVDVVVFNLMLSGSDPSLARVVAVVPAMFVTYLGNRLVTWRGRPGHDLRRELCLFLVFNAIGFGISIGTLAISHDLLGLTSRLADNISANVVGLGLGTLFRYVTYRSLVFAPQHSDGPRRATTLARCTSWWSTTRSAWSRSFATTSTRSERRRTDATTG